ncbi:hypothetical protein IAE30_27115 [Pantoea sp. S61]|uniref:hypothetical protein n=1 Tax=Pantoea sp. S61 TaxID=2767442 RepID=UPI0019096DEE|nr:hypothetical protein [Pantoea sp. S61]MBK0127420.1 hypothetical protein [Pantoea sp. S61]
MQPYDLKNTVLRQTAIKVRGSHNLIFMLAAGKTPPDKDIVFNEGAKETMPLTD